MASMSDQVIGGWTTHSGGRPASPKPLGRGPQAGYENPRFPTIGPKDIKAPPGGYQSIIDTSAPLDMAQLKRISEVKRPVPKFRGFKGAGGMSREAFADAVADTSEQTVKMAADKYGTDFQKQAEKSRAEDLRQQKGNNMDRYNMDVFKAIFDEDTRTRMSEGVKDMFQSFETVKKDEQAKRTAMILSFLGSMI